MYIMYIDKLHDNMFKDSAAVYTVKFASWMFIRWQIHRNIKPFFAEISRKKTGSSPKHYNCYLGYCFVSFITERSMLCFIHH